MRQRLIEAKPSLISLKDWFISLAQPATERQEWLM